MGQRTYRIRERGSVTAELAVTLPALMGILALLLVCAVTGVTQLRLEEAAWAGARAAARGESVAAAASTVRRIAGPGSEVDISTEGGWCRVQVSARVQGPLSGLVQWPLTAEAAAQRESYDQEASAAASGKGSGANGDRHSPSIPMAAVSPAQLPVMNGNSELSW